MWRLVGAQTSPVDAELRGRLDLRMQGMQGMQGGTRVDGAYDVVQLDARGTERRVAGALSGRAVDAHTLDLDVQLDGATRRHVGRVRGDSLVGTWVELPLAGGPPRAIGSFRAARER